MFAGQNWHHTHIRLARFSKVIAVCGSGKFYVESLGEAAHFVDCREWNVVNDLKKNALDGDRCFHAVDAINDGQSWRQHSEVLALEGSCFSVYLPRLDYTSIPPSPEVGVTFFGTVHGQPTPCWDQKCEEDVDSHMFYFDF